MLRLLSGQVQLRRDVGRVGPEHGPWIRARQIQRWIGIPDPVRPIAVVDRRGTIVGWGLPSERSALAVRILTWGEAPPASDWLAQRLERAIDARMHQGFGAQGTTGIRLINSEGDGLPGLVVDQYGTDRVMQLTTAPMVAQAETIRNLLRRRRDGRIHTIRSPYAAPLEGFTPGIELEGPVDALFFLEHGLKMRVPPPPSQKTGAYFDQRANRRYVATLAAQGRGPLLDLGCHVGGFALHAAAAGVDAVGVDRSAPMLALAAEHARLNDLESLVWVEADMFGPLDDAHLAGPFGTIVVDPPKIATRRRDVERATTAMQRMITRVAARLSVGGHLVLCSCSHHLGVVHLDRCTLALPGEWTRVTVRGADLDHPVAPAHVEGEYLRVAVYQRRR